MDTDGKRERKPKILKIKPSDLWPSTLCAGPMVVKFMTGPRGRTCKVYYRGRGKVRFSKRKDGP